MKQNFKYFFEFFHLSKGNSILLLFASLLSAVIQMLTAITIIPVIKQLDSDFELEGNVAVFSISIYEKFSQVFFTGSELVTAVSFMLVTLMLFSIISFVIESYSARVSALIVRQLRMEVLDTLINASWPYFGKKGSSDAVNHIITECAKIAAGYRKVILSSSNFIQAIVLLVFSFFVSFEVTIVVLSSSLLIVLLFLPILKMSKKLGENNRMLIKEVTDSTLTSFDNIKSIKAMSIDHFSTVLINSTKALEKNTYFLSIVSAITNNFRLPLTALIIVISLVILSAYDSTSAVLFLPLLFLFERITKTIGYSQNGYQAFLKTLPFYVSFNNSMRFAKKYKENVPPGQIDTINHIVFDCVSFSHSDSLVFENVSVSFNSPSFNLIIGESGSGKTTLIDLIIGLLSPNSGAVFVNEVNLNTINIKSYRSQIGFVPQEVFLLNTSLRDNVLIGRKNFSDKDILHALDLADLSNLCSILPHGLDSNLGENGRLISGGQRQRVLIARALLSNPSLLILDEPTSGLDSNSTIKFIDSIQRIKNKGILIIVISHDKMLFNCADKVLSVKNNSVVKV